MYPTISDLIKDIFGINVPLPIQSFGFFVAVSFVVAAWLVLIELKRKEREGIIATIKKTVIVGRPASAQELIIIGIFGFIIGFKLIGIIFDYSSFAEKPQNFIFSGQGNFFGGILGAAIAVYFRYREKQKTKLEKPKTEEIEVHPYELTGNFILYAALFGILGAKIFHNLENLDEFAADPVGSLFSFSGLTFYGGLIVAAVALIWYAKKNNIPPLVISDIAAPAIMIAYAIGRLGCQTAGDGDWGIANELAKPGWLSFMPDWFWAYDYPHNVINEGVEIANCTGKHCFHLVPPVFPTPLYETITCGILFIVLWVLRKRMQITGMMFSLFLIMNGVERFFVEKIRVNTKYHIMGWQITQAEIISTLLFITGVVLLIYIIRNQKKRRKIADTKPNP
jgi:phosphatidylglycerol---prolipoprotein diacylglyceryl transferase